MTVSRWFRSLAIGLVVCVCLLGALLVLAESFAFSGEISVAYEVDTYTFSAEEGDYIHVLLECEEPTTLDTYVELYDPDGNLVDYDDDGGDKLCGSFYASELTHRASRTGEYSVDARAYSSGVGPYTLFIDISKHPGQSRWFDPGDDRINRQAYASAAVYCDADHSQLVVYSIDAKGNGQQTIVVPYAELPAAPTGANVLVTQQGGVSIYRLVSGEYQLIGQPDAEGKQYVAVWDGCPYTYLNAYILQNGVLTQTESNRP